MNTPPSITTSTREERANFVRTQWECMHNCELCGKCHVLTGKDAEFIYSELLLSGKICLFILENTNCTNNTNPCGVLSLLIAYELHEYHPDGIRVIRL